MNPSETIVRLNTALEGRYRIERELGEGGMATVYLAQDLKHGRGVALKVLKSELAAVIGPERFLAEIETTARLQHPHILPLFDSGEAGGFLFYVMPLVQGESLKERLDRERQLPVDEAVRIAGDIAEALDYAHRQDVIHRDIKPANVLIHDGQPLVSDFGIALAVRAGGGGRLTETGLSLGTPHYMSPEQATGDQYVGPATDIYALGCVLYEMLVGQPPYTGSTPQAILGKVIAGELGPVSRERASVPSNVDAAIRRALEKVPADRFRRAGDFGTALKDTGFRHQVAGAPAEGRSSGLWKGVAAALAVVTLLLAAALAWPTSRRDATAVAPGVFPAPFLPGQEPNAIEVALSPDGTTLVYTGPPAEPGSPRRLWARRWDELEARPIPGTEGGLTPAFSPDGTRIAFEARGRVLTTTMDGTPPQVILRGQWPVWAGSDMLYATIPTGAEERGIWRAPATGGDAEQVFQPDVGDPTRYYASELLPGGARALLLVGAGLDWQVQILDFETGEFTPLVEGDMPHFLESGRLVYLDATEARRLVISSFDPATLEVGPEVPLLDDVSSFSLSRTGSLIYRAIRGGTPTTYTPFWLDRDGNARVVSAGWSFEGGGSGWTSMKLSPEGERLAVTIGPPDGNNLFVRELPDGPQVQLTRGFAGARRPSWFDDGRALIFNSAEGGRYGLWTVRADGSQEPERLPDVFDEAPFKGEYSSDGRWLTYYSRTADANQDVFAIRVDGSGMPIDTAGERLVSTPGLEANPTLSPDGRWLAYVSNFTGQPEVYVRPFPDAASALTQVSVDWGAEPLWAPDGRELFYVDREGWLVSAEYSGADGAFDVRQRTRLFDASSYLRSGRAATVFDVTPDGRRFMMLAVQEGEAPEVLWVLDQSFLTRALERLEAGN